MVDAVWWGERKEGTSWCSVVARDPKRKEDLWWSHVDTETTEVYLHCRNDLEALGYTLLSVTGDGFGGIRKASRNIPFQMCLVHMERIVTRGTTLNPDLEAGKVLLALTRSLHWSKKRDFHRRLDQYLYKYRDFLNEKTIHPSGEKHWTHEALRKAVSSLLRFEPYLFTWKGNTNIPKTTNSLEGHFRHIKGITKIHSGLSRENKQRVLDSIFLEGSISPKN